MVKKTTEVGDSLESLFNGSNGDPAKFLTENPDSNAPPTPQPSPSPLNRIGIQKAALKKLFIMAEEVSRKYDQALEIYALCIGSEGIITDIIIPRQRVSYASIHIEPAFIIEVGESIRKHQHNIIGWAHSHANFSVFFSGTDRGNQEVVLAETSNFQVIDGHRIKYAFGITVNMQHDLFGMVTTQFPNGEISNLQAQFDIIGTLPDNWDEKNARTELRKEIEAKVHTSNMQYSRPSFNRVQKPIDINDGDSKPKEDELDIQKNEKKDEDKPQILL